MAETAHSALKFFVYQEGRDFELSATTAAFNNSRQPVALLHQPASAEPDGYTLVDDPDLADFIVYPYNLECMVYPERALAANYFIRRLPYFHSHEDKHVFFNFHDRNQPLLTEALVITDDPNRGNKGDPHLATYPHCPGAHVAAAAPNFSFRKILYDTNYVGALSYPVRLAMVEAVQRENRIKYFIQHPNTLNWEDKQTSYHHMDNAGRKAEMERLYVDMMRQSWTTLCPRGMGSSSIRFYETLCMGRLPVHISDAYILPRQEEIDYSSFCLLVPEAAVPHTGELLYEWLRDKPLEQRTAMCLRARQVWEQYFRPEHFHAYSLALLRAHMHARKPRPKFDRYYRARHELAAEDKGKMHYKAGSFDLMEIDDRRLWLNAGLTVRPLPGGELLVNEVASQLCAPELLFLIDFASTLDINAVVVSLAPRHAAGAIAFANGLFHGRKLNATLYVAAQGNAAELRRDLEKAGADHCVRVMEIDPASAPAEFLQRFRPGSVSAIIMESNDIELDGQALSRLKPEGTVVRRNRIDHGFTLGLSSADRITERLFSSMKLVTPQQGAFRPGNLVMGVVSNYGKDKIAPFVLSLRNSGFTGELVLFTINVPAEVHVFLAEQGCHAVDVVVHPSFNHVSVNCLRYFLYRAFLDQFGATFAGVFISDVGDVIFQNDIFANVLPGSLCVFGESKLLHEEPWNSGWVRNVFGAHSYEAMRDCQIICSGTTLGDTQTMRHYLELMTTHMQPLHVALQEKHEPGTGMHGTDQGVHNYLMHNGLAPRFRILSNNDAAVYTYDGHHTLAENGQVATPQGKPFAVVHQYNRSPELTRHMLGRIGL